MDILIEQEFRSLCKQGLDIERVSLHAPDLEPVFIAIFNLVEAHPKKRDLFVRLFSEVAQWEIEAPYYLLEFCMRKLRYPEIKEQLSEELRAKELTPSLARRMNFLNAVLNVYDDVWRDEEMWPYYNNHSD